MDGSPRQKIVAHIGSMRLGDDGAVPVQDVVALYERAEALEGDQRTLALDAIRQWVAAPTARERNKWTKSNLITARQMAELADVSVLTIYRQRKRNGESE